MPLWLSILLIVVALLAGAAGAYFYALNKGKNIIEAKYEKLGKEAKKIISDAEETATKRQSELINEAKKEIQGFHAVAL